MSSAEQVRYSGDKQRPGNRQTRRMTMPVSNGPVELVMLTVDPDNTWVSPDINPRNQSLLSETDPAIVSLRHSIREESQRDPVLLRPNPGPGGEEYELIYGSRRRFVGLLEKRDVGHFRMLAEVGDIADGDARRLARVENQEREDLSTWEKAQDYARRRDTVYRHATVTEMALWEAVSQGTLSKYLRIADIPRDLIALLDSPHRLAVQSGQSLLKVIKEHGEENTLEVAAVLGMEGRRFDSVKKLVAALKQVLVGDETVKVSRRKPRRYANSSTGFRARLAAHRTRDGAYKIELDGVDNELLARIDDFLSNLSGRS